jgi:acyl dehydratase
MTASYRVRAHNAATKSENKIHDDDVARRYGFEGGLVPGVTVYAYMTHPVVATFGRPWLERGTMTARFVRPCYDGDDIVVEATVVGSNDAALELTATRGDEVIATGTASLPSDATPAPSLDAYPTAPLPDERPPVSHDTLAAIDALGSWGATFRTEHAPAFLDEIGEDLDVYGDGGPAHPGYLLLSANSILTANARLGPWMHVGSEVTSFGLVADGDRVSTRGRITRLFERKGHRFAELDLLLVANDTRPVQHVRHTVIYEIGTASQPSSRRSSST